MAQLKFVKADAVTLENIRGFGKEAGHVRKIIVTEKMFFNVDVVSPSFSPHHFYKHDSYIADGYKIEYPADFEEIYYILRGHGVMQWKTASGAVEEQSFGPSDTIFMPPDVVEHQLLNNSNEDIHLAVVGVPPPKKTKI